MKRIFLITILCMATLALLKPANAMLVTSIPSGTPTTTFTVTGFKSGLTSDTVNGFTITGLDFQDGGGGYSLGSNGVWSSLSFLATNGSATSFFRIDLGALYSTAGGFFNYAPGGFPGSDSTLTAIGADGTTVLEMDNLVTLAPISTPGAQNAGAFRAITLGAPTIRFLQVNGAYTVEHTITAASPPTTVPEPSTFLVLLPLAGLGLYVRRRSHLQLRP